MQNELQETHQENDNQVQELRNDNVRLRLTKKPGCKVSLEVFVEPLAAKAAYESAFKNVKKEVSIPGFRKGKVPDEIIMKNYAPHVEREWKDVCLQTAFRESIALTHLNPLSRNSIKRSQLKKCSKEEGAEAIFEYESEPFVQPIDIKAIETKAVAPKKITNEEIEWELKKQRIQHATFEEISDRAVQEGDYVELDLDVIESPAHNVFTNKLFCVTKEDMPHWVYELVPGMQLNESREGNATPDSDDESCEKPHVHTAECSHSKEASKLCRLTCTAIKRGILPEVSDEFATKFGFQTAQELNEKIEEILQKNANTQAQEETRSRLAFELLQRYPIDLPQTLVDAEVNARFRYVKKIQDAQHGSLPVNSEEETKLRDLVGMEVRNFFSCMYLLNQIAKDLQISVTQEELVEEVTFETTALAPYQRLVYPGIDPNEARNRMFMRVMMRRVLDWLLAQNAISPS